MLIFFLPLCALEQLNLNNLANKSINISKHEQEAPKPQTTSLNNMFNTAKPAQEQEAPKPLLGNMFNKMSEQEAPKPQTTSLNNMFNTANNTVQPAQEQVRPQIGLSNMFNMMPQQTQQITVQEQVQKPQTEQKSWWQNWFTSSPEVQYPEIRPSTPGPNHTIITPIGNHPTIDERMSLEQGRIFGQEQAPAMTPQEIAQYSMGRDAMMRGNSSFWGPSPEEQARIDHLKRLPGHLQGRYRF